MQTDAAVVIDGDRIAAVGPSAELLARYPEAERVGALPAAPGAPGRARGDRHAPPEARRGLSPRVAELEAPGCLVMLGTDNMAEDRVQVIRTAVFTERVRRQDGRRPTPEEALVWATCNGGRTLGLPDGRLSPGNRADLIMVDLRAGRAARG